MRTAAALHGHDVSPISSYDMMSESRVGVRRIAVESLRTGDVPDDLTGIHWDNGWVECRARVVHPDGPLAAAGRAHGTILTDAAVVCDTCSDACS
jgi:hypothetical protein